MSLREAVRNVWRSCVNAVLPLKPRSARSETYTDKMLYGLLCPMCKRDHLSLLPYANPMVKDFLFALKYEHHMRSAELAATLLAHSIEEECIEQDTLMHTTYLITPVPSSKDRMEREAYDHLALVVAALRRHVPKERATILPTLLKWTRPVQRQTTLSSTQERTHNVRGAMTVNLYAPTKHVTCIVFDDIITTGATLEEAKRALQTAGIKDSITIALARA